MTNRPFKTGESREQASLLPPRIEDYVGPDNPVRAIESFVCALDLAKLGFRHADRRAGRGGTAALRSSRPVEALSLRLHQPGQIVAPAGAGSVPQSGTDLALEELEAGLSDDRQLPQGELGGAEGSEPQLRAAGARAWPCRRQCCGDRRLVLPWRCQQGEHLYAQEARRTDHKAGPGDRGLRQVS